MVYKSPARFFRNLPRYLQQDCLICKCAAEPGSIIFGLCHYCEASLPRLQYHCRCCAIPLELPIDYCGQCLQQRPHFNASHCAVLYQGKIPALIHQLKHRHDKAINHLLGDLFMQSLPAIIPNIDVILPVPMHIERNLQRGNNHCDLLSTFISKQLQVPFDKKLLQRTELTATQHGLSAKKREHNLKQAFTASESLKGIRIAVLDDVITTGSTMNEIAKTLKGAGASDVYAWAIARTPKYF